MSRDHSTSPHAARYRLRHSAITNVYRATRDLYLTRRFARHSSPLTTTMYTHPSDEELYAALRGIKPDRGTHLRRGIKSGAGGGRRC